MLVLTRKVDESIMIGDDIRITVVAVKGDHVRVGVDAPKNVPIHRREVYEEILGANLAAASAPREMPALPVLSPTAPGRSGVSLDRAGGGRLVRP